MTEARYCRKCGTKMAHFDNPSRYICPKVDQHKNLPEDKARSEAGKKTKGRKWSWLQRQRHSRLKIEQARKKKKGKNSR